MIFSKIKMIKQINQTVVTIALVLAVVGVAQAASNIDAVNKWAWGTNGGWVNFAPSHGSGVTVYDDHLEGYAWAENLGWIRLGTTGSGSPYYDNDAANTYGVNRAPDTGALSGYAWSPTVGWIKFDPTHGGVTVDGSGSFAGYAWGENIGWIHFQHSDPPVYGVLARLPDAPIPTLSEWGMLAFVTLVGGYAVRRLRRKSAD